MKWQRVITFIVFLALVMTACSEQPTATPQATDPPPPAPTDTPMPEPTPLPTDTPIPEPEPTATEVPPTEVPVMSEMVDVGGYEVYVNCVGEGSPTVVLVSSHGQDHAFWTEIVDNVNVDLEIRVCTYDRAGIGQSDPLPAEPRTNQAMSDELRALLVNAEIPGPYILAGVYGGHSITRVFADQYPDDIAGMILIGSGFEVFVHNLLTETLPPEEEGEDPTMTMIRGAFSYYLGDPMQQGEQFDLMTSLDQVEAVDSLGDIPLMVIASDIFDMAPVVADWPNFFGGAEFTEEVLVDIEADRALQYLALAGLSTDSELIVIRGCNFNIVGGFPDVIAEAIENMVNKVRSQ